MWYLTNSTGDLIYIKPKNELTFGRKRSDIILQNDESISRLHASIYVNPKDIVEGSEPISTCSLKDMGSKYGTYVFSGDKQIEVTKEKYLLKDKDKIRFGLQQHIFIVSYVPIITVVSTLNDTEKNTLHSLMDEIDGMILPDWSSTCTHLTVSKATLTEKVTMAMASAIPIVSIKYWEHVKDAFENGRALPDPNDFVPCLSEALINKAKVLLSPNEKRRTLFKHLIFVHFNKRQYQVYGKMIKMAGGQSILYTKRPLSNKELCAPNVHVLKYSNNDASQSTQCIVTEYDSIEKALQTAKRRMIAESEIPLAIMHCSINMYCNPKFNFANFLKRSQTNPDSSDIVALDTQDIVPNTRMLPKVISNVSLSSGKRLRHVTKATDIIPETCDTLSNIGSTSKDHDDISKEETSSTQAKGYIPETEDIVANTQPLTAERSVAQSIEKIIYKKSTVHIPETNDSYDKEDDKNESIHDISSIASNLDTNTLEHLGNSVTITRVRKENTQKVSPTNGNYIPETNDSFNVDDSKTERECDESVMIQSPAKENSNINSPVNEVLSINKKLSPSKTILNLDDNHSLKRQIEFVDITESNKNYNVTTEKKSSKLCKVGDTIDFNIEDDVLQRENSETNANKRLEEQLPTHSELIDKNDKNNKRLNESICTSDDDEFSVCNEKRIRLHDPEMDNQLKSPDPVLPRRNEVSHNSNKLTKNDSLFLRNSPGAKKFKKVYKSIPKKRITLQDMYVWSGCNVRIA